MPFPTSVSSLARPTPSTKTNAGSGLNLSTVLDAISDDLEAVETKLGTGASTPTANTVLRGTGAGTSAYGSITNAHVDAAAAIAFSKLGANVAAVWAVTIGSNLSINSTTQAEMSSGYRITVTPKSASSILILIAFVPIQLGQNEVANMGFAQNGTAIGTVYGQVSNNEGDAVINSIHAAYAAIISAGSTSSRNYSPAWASGGAYQIDSNASGIANGLFLVMEYLP